MTTVGMIGLGTMGAGMATNLAKRFNVIAYNRTHAKAQQLAGGNINAAQKLQDVANADIIFTCVSNDAAVAEVYVELLSHVKKSTILVDCSTVSIELTKKIAEDCKRAGISFLDAPITGSKRGAEGGKLVFMVGGDKVVFEKIVPVLTAMGQVHVYCGASTYGQRAKLALNLAQSLILESYLETLVFAVKNGVPLAAMETIMENSGAKSGVGTFKLGTIKQRDFSAHFKWSLMCKDLKLAEAERKKLGLHLPLSEKIVSIFEESKARADEDFSTIVKALEKEAGIELK